MHIVLIFISFKQPAHARIYSLIVPTMRAERPCVLNLARGLETIVPNIVDTVLHMRLLLVLLSTISGKPPFIQSAAFSVI